MRAARGNVKAPRPLPGPRTRPGTRPGMRGGSRDVPRLPLDTSLPWAGSRLLGELRHDRDPLLVHGRLLVTEELEQLDLVDRRATAGARLTLDEGVVTHLGDRTLAGGRVE